MKERPLLMTTEMVKADRDGRKTMTRRTAGLDAINERPHNYRFTQWVGNRARFLRNSDGGEFYILCPYGEVGDRLWIRETWAVQREFDTIKPVMLAPEDCKIWYAADGGGLPSWAGKTRASIHMPREFSRRTVEIVEIRVERLQDISEADAIAEGVRFSDLPPKGYKNYLADASGYGHPDFDFPIVQTARESYRTLIVKIHGPKVWDDNHWVWVIKYKHL